MRFGSIIVAGLAAVASAMPAKEVSSNIDAVTLKSRELQVPAKSPTIIDGPLLTARQGKIPVSSTFVSDQCVADLGLAHYLAVQRYYVHLRNVYRGDVDEQGEVLRRWSRPHLQLLPRDEHRSCLRNIFNRKVLTIPVCDGPPRIAEYPHQKGRPVHHRALHWPAHGDCARRS